LETMSVQPVLFRVRGFLQEEECAEIVGLAKGRMASSPVSLMDKDRGRAAKEFRTSTQARVNVEDSKYLEGINNRIARLTNVPLAHNEEVQILRYEKTQYYAVHMDNWDPKYYSGQDTSFMDHGHTNRLATVFWYLTNVSKGGETLFPRADGNPSPRDTYACDQGLKVKPERGTVILWYSLRPNGNTDDNGSHGACPVKGSEEKWSANYWVWNKPRARGSQMPDAGVDEGEQHDSEDSDAVPPDGKVSASFTNRNPTEPIEIFWVRPEDGVEKHLGILAPEATQSMNTFVGHNWVFKTGPTSPRQWVQKITIDGKRNEQWFNLRPPDLKDDL